MQYIPQFDSSKPVSFIAGLAENEPVTFSGPKGRDLVIMTRGEYDRITRSNIERFERTCREVSEEAQRNGLTQEILDEILKDVS